MSHPTKSADYYIGVVPKVGVMLIISTLIQFRVATMVKVAKLLIFRRFDDGHAVFPDGHPAANPDTALGFEPLDEPIEGGQDGRRLSHWCLPRADR
jgi:hypothetical protein